MQIVNIEGLQPNEKKLSKEGQEEADVEPSMEDILASIRRILSEEEKEAAIEENLEPKEAVDAELQPEERLGDEPEKEMDVVPDMEADEPEKEPDMAATVETDDSKPNIDSEVESMETEPSQANSEPDTQYKDDDVLELTEAMIAPADSLMSGKTTELSSDVLSELARAIMDRREMGIGDKDVTLEGMVREMLRPILREWLDRNLPHLIERLVKKEIDKMVNRAEMFKDL